MSASTRCDDRKEFVRQLFETRRFLELPIIELATERATPLQRAEIRRPRRPVHRRHDARRSSGELDRAFHSLIAQACGNPLLVEVYHKVLARLFRSDGIDSLLSDAANRAEVRRIVTDSTAQHAALATAVAVG